jgi:hypothetical protein
MKHGAKGKVCSSDGCTNVAVKGGVCKRHGARHLANTRDVQIMLWKEACALSVVQRSNDAALKGAPNQAREGGVCIKHGATWTKKRCSREGCTNFAVKGGVCRRHGAKVKLCSIEGCTKQSVRGGLCRRHVIWFWIKYKTIWYLRRCFRPCWCLQISM